MAQRICPNCGHVENEYTFFCTECGTKTVEDNNGNQGAVLKPIKPFPGEEKSVKPVLSEDNGVKPVLNEGQLAGDDKINVSEDILPSETSKDIEENQSPMMEGSIAEAAKTSEFSSDIDTSTEKKLNPKINPIMAGMGAVILILIVVIIGMSIHNGRSDEEMVANSNQAYEEQDNDIEDVDSALQEDYSAEEGGIDNYSSEEEQIDDYVDEDTQLRSDFGIDTATIEDYSANLDPSQYLYYDSGIGEFNFYYPGDLFNDVSVDDEYYSTEYGNNIKSICFYGSNGSELYYSIYERNDGGSISEATDRINNLEHGKYYEMSDILVKSDDEKGRIVLAGVMDASNEYRLYDLIKVDSSYVYRMLSVKPMYRNEDERVKYAYVTENEYRMCGFSGSSSEPRSFEEYLAGN